MPRLADTETKSAGVTTRYTQLTFGIPRWSPSSRDWKDALRAELKGRPPDFAPCSCYPLYTLIKRLPDVHQRPQADRENVSLFSTRIQRRIKSAGM